jgi:AcrR family transcriptional regulator
MRTITMPAAVRGKKKANPSRAVHSREQTASRILSEATRLFVQKGYEGTSVKDICAAAGANIAAIHYHFGSKESLYRRIIEQFAAESLESARRILETPQNLDDLKVRLEIFLRQSLEAMIRQPDVVLLILRDIEMFDSKREEVYRNTLLKHFETLVGFLNQAKKKKLLAADVEPFLAAGYLLGQIQHEMARDKMKKKYFGYSLEDEKYRTRWIQHTIRLFLGGIIGK